LKKNNRKSDPILFSNILNNLELILFFKKNLIIAAALPVPPPRPAKTGTFLLTIILYLLSGCIKF